MIIIMENGIKIINNRKSNIKHIVVAGGGGFVGRYFVKYLLKTENNIKIIVVTRNPGRKMFFKDDRVEIVTSFKKLKIHDAVVYNFAYTNSMSFKKGKILANKFIDELSDSLIDGYTGKVIHISSVAVYDAQTNENAHKEPAKLRKIRKIDPYSYIKAFTERKIENNCKNKNVKFNIVRIGNVMAPGSTWVQKIVDRYLNGEPIIEQTIKHYSNTTFIGNLIYILSKMADNCNDRNYFNLCEWGNKSWEDWITLLSEIYNAKVVSWPVSNAKYLKSGIKKDFKYLKKTIVNNVAPNVLKLTGINTKLLILFDLFNIDLEKTRDKTKRNLRLGNTVKDYYMLKEYQLSEIYLNTKKIGLEGFDDDFVKELPFSFEMSVQVINNYLHYNKC